ncbi:TR1L1 protein, partial [Turnix velox]|nr:TR1L1 protein [Turnix velox]
MLLAINLHAVIQASILDKIKRHLYLSKTQHSKFNESGQLAFFYLFSLIWGASVLNRLSNFQVKFYYICQIAYWLHALVEIYFQNTRKGDIPRQLCYICLYLVHISGAYILNLQYLGLILMLLHYLVELFFHALRLFYFRGEKKQKGFTVWAVLFITARLLTVTFYVLAFGFELAGVFHKNTSFPTADGNFVVYSVRICCLGAVSLTQAWMMWKFLNFQIKKCRKNLNQILKKIITTTKNRQTKKGPSRGQW